MLGFSDPWIAAAYWGCVLVAALCVVYGVLNWNKGDAPPPPSQTSKRSERRGRTGGSR